MKDAKTHRVNAVHRGLQILELLAGQKRALGTSEISRKLKIPKSTASYLLHTLQTRGYLRREGDAGAYRLSMKLLALGGLALKGVEIREIALPILRKLSAETGSTAHLAVLEGNEAIYIERVPSPGFIQMDTWVGRRMPLHSTSAGKVLLASLPEQVAENLAVTGLTRFTAKTITTLPRLKQELKRARDNGFCVDDEENTPGVRCVAAPVFDRHGTVVGAITLTSPVQHVTPERLPRIVERVKEAAREMSRLLGGTFLPTNSRRLPQGPSPA